MRTVSADADSGANAQLVDVAADGSGDRKVLVDLGTSFDEYNADWRVVQASR